MTMVNDNRSVPELFTDLITQLTTLVRKEIQLARTEISEKITGAVAGLGTIIGGAVLMIAALVILLESFSLLLAFYAGLGSHWSYLIIGVVAALIGYLVVRSGLSALQADKLAPTKTVEQLSRDAAAAREQVR